MMDKIKINYYFTENRNRWISVIAQQRITYLNIILVKVNMIEGWSEYDNKSNTNGMCKD